MHGAEILQQHAECKPSRRLADYESDVHGVECVRMSSKQISWALADGELKALVCRSLSPRG